MEYIASPNFHDWTININILNDGPKHMYLKKTGDKYLSKSRNQIASKSKQ